MALRGCGGGKWLINFTGTSRAAMDDRVIEVLRGALDEAELKAKRAHGEAGPFLIDWGPTRVLRLVQRDRELLTEYEMAASKRRNALERDGTADNSPYWPLAAYESALKSAVDLAARFWIGEETPDGHGH
jgi:hypothetical protein